jgi:GT2 family glycosyltransferase
MPITPSHDPMPSVIIPCHNRKAVTLACLGMLRPLMDCGWSVIVVDDGSTDGTSDEINTAFPTVTMLHGDGNLFWTGAIELGMRHAIAQGSTCCIWLNDDVTIQAEAIERVFALAMEKNAMVSGQGKIHFENGSVWWFPASQWMPQGIKHTDVGETQDTPYPVDACRGNLVAVPKSIVDAIGYPDGNNIPHVGGDTDYSLRATRAGFACFVDPDAVFWEEENIRMDNRSWLLDDRTPSEIFIKSLSRRGILYPRMLFTYQIRHWRVRGLFRAIMSYIRLFAILMLKMTLPKSLRLRLFARHSHAYQAYAIRGIES